MYSQNDEEQIILDYFKTNSGKRLLDIGAYDGKSLSNSLALIEMGWTGVLIEASPTNFTKIIREYPHLDKIDAVCAAIGTSSKLVKFHDSGEMVSTTDPAHLEKWSGQNWPAYHIMMLSPDDLLSYYPDQFDFINVDVEGYSFELFSKLLPLYPSCKCWCVEHDTADNPSNMAKLQEIAFNNGFRKIGFNGENIILAK